MPSEPTAASTGAVNRTMRLRECPSVILISNLSVASNASSLRSARVTALPVDLLTDLLTDKATVAVMPIVVPALEPPGLLTTTGGPPTDDPAGGSVSVKVTWVIVPSPITTATDDAMSVVVPIPVVAPATSSLVSVGRSQQPR